MINNEFSRIENFFTRGKRIFYKKGETIIRSEDEPQGIYFVENGFVKMNSVFEDGKLLIVNIFKPKTYFPMIWALTDIPNSYSFEAMTKVSLIRVSKDEVLNFIEKNPDVLRDLSKRIMSGLDGLIKNMEQLIRGQAQKRVLAALHMSAKRFGRTENGKLLIEIPLTHQDVADMSALSRETTTITLNKLRKEKLISFKYRIIRIEDIQKFEKLIGLGGWNVNLTSE